MSCNFSSPVMETWIFAFLNAKWGLAVLICTKMDKSLSFSCKFLVLSDNARCGAVVAQDYAGKLCFHVAK